MQPSNDARPSVPDHELLRKIGQGSYGEVWLARNVMGSFRAVKVVYRKSFESERPYEREFSGLQKFEPVSRTHPGLVSILHMGRTPAHFYCVMEVADDAGQHLDKDIRAPELYVPRTLAYELSKRGRLPVEECVELGVALAEALGHLHAHGLVHRDIKPSNIIFVGGIPKLADIGLVTRIGTKASFVGTEGYIPPEGPGSPGADLYSLGKVLYELSTGKAAEQFPELPTRLPELPEAPEMMRLNNVVLRTCEHSPAKRFRSAEQLRTALVELRPSASRSRTGRAAPQANGPGAGRNILILSPSASPADVSVAGLLANRLASEGFTVFSDEQPVLSVEWARRIEHQIRNAHVVIPILSQSSIESELMAYALEVAQQAARRPAKLPQVTPVLVQLDRALPRHLALSIEGFAAVPADGATNLDGLIQQVLAAADRVRNQDVKAAQTYF